MENARIAIFEDDERLRYVVGRFLGYDGHEVVAAAATLPEARAVIDDLGADDLDVAIVDGNLDGTSSGADGAEVTRLLRQKFSSVTIIGYSGSQDVVGVDHNVTKGGRAGEQLSAIIASI